MKYILLWFAFTPTGDIVTERLGDFVTGEACHAEANRLAGIDTVVWHGESLWAYPETINTSRVYSCEIRTYWDEDYDQ